MKHTPEPWVVFEGDRIGNGEEAIASFTTYFNQKDKENAERAVICVNALEGIPNEDLEGWPGIIGQKEMMQSKEIATLKEQRDILLKSEKNLSEAYLRIRTLLNAFDTPHAPTPEQIWEHTEQKLKELIEK